MTALINGKFVPPEQAVVSVIDRSFLYGDGVFETIPVYNSKPFRWAQHLERLTRGADFLKIRLDFAPKELRVLASELIEVQSLLRESPRKVSDILSLLSENKLQVRMTGLEESHLMESLQKIANRIAAGLVTAALIMASSLMMRIESNHTLFGYPAMALVLFFVGAGLGIAIVLSALLGDRKAKPHEERGPR